jgi:hypothetical protein
MQALFQKFRLGDRGLGIDQYQHCNTTTQGQEERTTKTHSTAQHSTAQHSTAQHTTPHHTTPTNPKNMNSTSVTLTRILSILVSIFGWGSFA